jgi:predicted NUDIX family NTP pyrophosphohydrolase
VHPGGPFWSRKDEGAWTIPKGEIEDGEAPFDAAKREFEEETGHPIDGKFIALEPIKQRGGKIVVAWAVKGDLDPARLRSLRFEMEWPPRSGRRQSFPEVDRAEWFDLPTARRKILGGQAPFLDDLVRRLGQ